MAEETMGAQAASLIWEIVYKNLLLMCYVLRAVYRCVVPPELKNVNGEIVLITGAGHGMGREIAMRFARLGAVVVCVDLDAKGNEETLLTLKEEKAKAFRYECDVTDRAAVMELAEKVKREVGDVTVLVNNAAVMPCKPLLQHTEQEIRKTIDVNVHGYFWTIQAFLPSMVSKNHGHLVSMCSMAGLMGIKNVVPYCASKYAVKGMMDGLAVELNDNPDNKIKLTTVCPYIVNTGMCKKPRVRFPSIMKIVEPGEAADLIVDAMRRNYMDITVPSDLHYINRYYFRMFPFAGRKLIQDFVSTELEPTHD